MSDPVEEVPTQGEEEYEGDPQQPIEEEDDLEEPEELPLFSFQITDPSKNQNGKTLSFWVYKIHTKTDMEEFKNEELVVTRRFNHFVWLRQQLVDHNPGCIVPPLPEKSLLGTVEKFVSSVDTSNLLEYRQRALTKFVCRIGEHGVLHSTLHFKNFISMTFEEFEAFKKIKEKKPKQGVTWFKKSLTREHPWITHQKKFIVKMEEVLKALKFRLQDLVKRRREMASSISEFGKHWKNLAMVEKAYDPSSFNLALSEVAAKNEKLNVSVLSQADRETMCVNETLTYYLGMCEAMKKNMKVLDNMRLERDDATHSLNQQRAQLTRITKEDSKRKQEDKIAKTEKRQQAAEKKLLTAEEYFKDDIEKFDVERRVDFTFMLHEFVKMQEEFHGGAMESWAEIRPVIEAVETGLQ